MLSATYIPVGYDIRIGLHVPEEWPFGCVTVDRNLWWEPPELTAEMGIIRPGYTPYIARAPFLARIPQLFQLLREHGFDEDSIDNLDLIYVDELALKSVPWQRDLYTVEPMNDASRMEFLGFDVANQYFESGRYNFGLTFEELGIQDDRVISNIKLARKVRAICNRVLVNDPGFGIYRIFRLRGWRSEYISTAQICR